MPEKWILQQYKSLPLIAKVRMSQSRIREWYDHWQGNVVVSFSGGKDSTVLAHLVHTYYPEVPLIFSNTGLEYPEIQQFAKKMGAVFIRPKMSFSEVISKYGYPIISKENAEAIYYARRIRNGGGARQLIENVKNSKEPEFTFMRSKKNLRGGVQNRTIETSPDSVRRNLLMGGNGIINGKKQTGTNGEEEPLPG